MVALFAFVVGLVEVLKTVLQCDSFLGGGCRNFLAGLAGVAVSCCIETTLAVWVAGFITVCVETRWPGQKTWFLIAGRTLYAQSDSIMLWYERIQQCAPRESVDLSRMYSKKASKYTCDGVRCSTEAGSGQLNTAF